MRHTTSSEPTRPSATKAIDHEGRDSQPGEHAGTTRPSGVASTPSLNNGSTTLTHMPVAEQCMTSPGMQAARSPGIRVISASVPFIDSPVHANPVCVHVALEKRPIHPTRLLERGFYHQQRIGGTVLDVVKPGHPIRSECGAVRSRIP